MIVWLAEMKTLYSCDDDEIEFMIDSITKESGITRLAVGESYNPKAKFLKLYEITLKEIEEED